MSLINDLLHDLEDRRDGSTDRHEVFSGLSAAEQSAIRHDGRHKGGGMALAAVLITMAIALFVWARNDNLPLDEAVAAKDSSRDSASVDAPVSPPTVSRTDKAETTTAETGAVEIDTAETGGGSPYLRLDEALSLPASAPVKTAAAEEDPAAEETAVVVRDVKLRTDESGTKAVISLSAASDYRLYRLDSPDRVVLEIPDADTSRLGAKEVSNEAIQSVRHGLHDGFARIVFDLKRPLQLEGGVIEKGGDDHSIAFLLRENSDEDTDIKEYVDSEAKDDAGGVKLVHNRQMEKKPRDNSDESLAESAYKRGIHQYNRGELAESIKLLGRAVQLRPENGKARYMLAAAFLKNGQPDRAMALLSQSLDVVPENHDIRKLYAQLLHELDQSGMAADILNAGKPPLAEEPEYHALHAAILQGLGRHDEAAGIYRSLVGQYPENSLWWLGLGISLEAMDSEKQALTAYREALQDNALADNLKQFIGRRIQLLTGEQRT